MRMKSRSAIPGTMKLTSIFCMARKLTSVQPQPRKKNNSERN